MSGASSKGGKVGGPTPAYFVGLKKKIILWLILVNSIVSNLHECINCI